jgi:hypothetical protein
MWVTNLCQCFACVVCAPPPPPPPLAQEDGSLYDSKKYVWLQGRQVWMFSKLFNGLSEEGAPGLPLAVAGRVGA